MIHWSWVAALWLVWLATWLGWRAERRSRRREIEQFSRWANRVAQDSLDRLREARLRENAEEHDKRG